MNLKETKKSIKEEIDRPTWSKWVVNYLLPKGSRFRASSTQVGSLSYE